MIQQPEETKIRGFTGDPESQYQYGTFQGVANYYHPPPQPAVGFPQPVAPPNPSAAPFCYPHGYQTVHGYAVVEQRFLREPRLPCCGLGVGWLLFILGFLFGGFPWYLGALILLLVHVDYREKPGYVACTIAAVLVLIALMLGVTSRAHGW